MREIGADPSPESIDRELAKTEARKRRNRVVLGASALFAVLGVVALQFARTHRDKTLVTTAWTDAAGCLFGGPLRSHERASLRVHALQLARVGHEDSWPERCADPLATLHHALLKQKRGETLAHNAHKLMTELATGRGSANISYLVDQLNEAAAALGLTPFELPVSAGLKPAEPFNLSSMPADARIAEEALGAHTISTDRWPGSELWVLLHDAKSDTPPIVCMFSAAGPDARCRKVEGAARNASELRLGGTTSPGAEPLLFARALSEDVVFRSDSGREVTRGNLQSAYIEKDGSVTIATGPLDDQRGTFELLRQPTPSSRVAHQLLDPDDFAATTITNWAVAHGVVLLQTVAIDEQHEEDARPHLRFVALPGDTTPKHFTDMGELDWVNAPMAFCRTPSTLALVFGSQSGYLAFEQNGAWSEPVYQERLGNLVTCQGDAVLLHDFGPIRRCTSKGCTDAKLPDADFGEWSHVRARRAVLGESLLGVAESEIREGVRFVHGTAPPELLFDDLVRNGEVQVNSTLSGTRIFSRAGFAVVTLFTEEGVFAFYFGPDGTPQPARVTWR